MDVSLIDIAVLLLTLATPVVGYFVKQQEGQITALKLVVTSLHKELADHKLYAAENFTRKDDMKEMRKEILDAIRSLERKIDGEVG